MARRHRKALPLALLALGTLLLALLLAAPRMRRDRDAPPPLGTAPLRAEISFAWPEFPARRAVRDPARLRELSAALAAARRVPGPLPPHLPYWRVTLEYRGGKRREVLASHSLAAYLPEEGAYLEGERLRAFLARETGALARRFFGDPVPWTAVDRLWPWDAKVVVRDLETGLRFVADRYGGYRHADAQPATPRDTAVMRAIYRGRWSWFRRAVVVEIGSRRIAASMNGMPHGEGTILDNDFPGHFCIHFAGSTTHGSRRSDPGHRLMILKASGRLPAALDSAPPHEVAVLALTAAFQQDTAALRYASDRVDDRLRRELFRRLEHLEIGPARTLFAMGDTAVAAVDVTVYARPDPDRGHRTTLRILLLRRHTPPAPPSGWKVRFADLARLLPPEGKGDGEGATGQGSSRMTAGRPQAANSCR